MNATSVSVAATICGKNYECKIDRSEIGLFEGLHGSAFNTLSKFQHGIWTERDIIDVLNFALDECVVRHARKVGLNGIRDLSVAEMLKDRLSPVRIGADRVEKSAPKTVIERALRERGPMRYVPLCIGVLLAALDGLPEKEAVFTDEDGENGENP